MRDISLVNTIASLICCVLAFRRTFQVVIDARDGEEKTALLLAMEKKRLQVVKILLEFDAGIVIMYLC